MELFSPVALGLTLPATSLPGQTEFQPRAIIDSGEIAGADNIPNVSDAWEANAIGILTPSP